MSEEIVGRRGELEEVERFVAAVPTGTRALLVEGEPGIGKTRLWSEGVERARRVGHRVLLARPGGGEVQLALAGLADLVEPVLDDVLPELPPPQRRALATALLLDDVAAAVDERAVAAAFLGSIRALTRAGPLVLAVDDLQWLDRASARMLEFAFRRLEAEPVGLLATVRVASGVEDPAELRRAVRDERLVRLVLGPLSVGALYEAIERRLGLRLSRPVLLRVHAAAGGNPFFALELARALGDTASTPAPDEPLPVPRELGELLRGRLARVSASAARVLVPAAALSQPTRELLEAATGDPAASARGLADAVAAGILEVDGDRVRFTHPLLASVAYSTAAPAERRAVHAHLAAIVADAEERARHLALAATGPAEHVAVELAAAAERAEARGAVAAAAELAERAVVLTPPGARALHERRLAAARRAFAAGANERAEALLADALAAARPGCERAEALVELAALREVTRDIRAGLDLYRRAADEASSEPALRASILERSAGAVAYWGGGFAVALEQTREAVRLAERAGEAGLLARALAQCAYMEFSVTGAIPEDLIRRAAALEESTGGGPLDGRVGARHARMLVDTGAFAAAREVLEPLCARGRAAGDASVCWPLIELASVEFAEGRWERALELAREAHELSAQSGREAVEGPALFTVALVEGSLGDLDAGRRRALSALELTERTGRLSGGPRAVLGLLELSAGRYAEAYTFLEPAIERYRARSASPLNSLVSDGAEALAALGRVDDARALLDAFAERAGAVRYMSVLAVEARVRGVVEAAAGELATAEAALGEAVRLAEEARLPFELGRSLLALGSVQRRLRQKAAARETLSRAQSVFDELGARTWAERATAELGRIGGRSSPRTGLSATEAEIARLVAEGRTNREVAEILHLSTHTVEWNLSRIYRKLGVRSRTELAAHPPG